MELTQEELIELNEALIKPFGHPDPLGYVARVLATSGGDPDYVDLRGKMGFMPVKSQRAMDMTGAQSVVGLEDNVIATLTMDRMLITQYNGDVDRAMIDFHFENSVNPYTVEQEGFIEGINQARLEVKKLLYPRLATVKDVIEALDQSTISEKLDNKTKKFIEKLMEM